MEQYHRAMAIQEVKALNLVDLAISYKTIGSVLKGKGYLEGARAYLEQSHAILTGEEVSIVAWHPSMIDCKYHLGLLHLEEGRFEEAFPFANYIIQHLRQYKFAYHLKARALVELERLDESLGVYDEVIVLAPNYGDAHVSRLKLRSVLIDRQERARQDNILRFLEDYQTALEVDPGVVDSADEEVKKRFEMEWRREDSCELEIREAAETPTVDILDRETLSLKLVCFRRTFEEYREQLNNKAAQINDLGNTIGQNLSNTIQIIGNRREFAKNYADTMEKVIQRSDKIKAMIEVYAGSMPENVTLSQRLQRIEEKFVSHTTQLLEIREALDTNRNTLFGVTCTDNLERSKAVLSFLATGDTIPCPKRAVMIPRSNHNWLQAFFVNPWHRLWKCENPIQTNREWHIFFLCDETNQIAHPNTPMVVELDREWVRRMAPWIKAASIAANIACRVSTDLSLPFSDFEWAKAMGVFKDLYKDAMEEDELEVMHSLETWQEVHTGNEDQLTNPEDSDRLLHMKRLTGASYRAFSTDAILEKNRCCWSKYMELQISNDEIMWVAKKRTLRNDNIY